MARKLSLSGLRKKADRVFSAWIRARDAGKPCCTCGSRKGPMHAGHYIKRQHLGTRYAPQNVHAQCARCNLYLGGNMDEYAKFLVATYGNNILNDLAIAKHQTIKPTRQFFENIIERYS